MTMLLYDGVLRFVYALSIYWTGALMRAVLLALVGTVVLAAWRLRNPVPTGVTRWLTTNHGKPPIGAADLGG